MTLLKKIEFDHEEKKYEIRILHEDSKINIVVFFNNRPFNGYRYQIHFSKNIDIEKFLDVKNFENLIEAAKKDVVNKEWDKFVN
jgi:hypothetical protein